MPAGPTGTTDVVGVPIEPGVPEAAILVKGAPEVGILRVELPETGVIEAGPPGRVELGKTTTTPVVVAVAVIVEYVIDKVVEK